MARIRIQDLEVTTGQGPLKPSQLKSLFGGISSEPVYTTNPLGISSEPVYTSLFKGSTSFFPRTGLY